ncbi:MAG: hypothetical protein AAFN92_12725 [Bacteroidota bacterium]
MNKLLIWLVGLAGPFWRQLGADPRATGLILRAKLLMDDRGGSVMGRQKTSQKKGMEWLLYGMLTLFGALLIILPIFIEDTPTAIGLVYCAWMVYIGLMLITEMSENLFDQRDLYVLLSRPINSVTLSLARILHIAAFSAKFALCLGVPTGIYLAVAEGIPALLVYGLLGVLAVAITMTGTLVFYLILLRRVPPERLKKFVGYFQMVATGFFFFAYQIPNLFGGEFEMLGGVQLVDAPWGFAFPGLWLGGLYKTLLLQGPGALALVQGLLGLTAATVGGWFYVRQSRGYVNNLLALREVGSGGAPEVNQPATVGEKGFSFREWFALRLTRPNLERASFRFHWNMMTRSMGFKQRTLPSLVYLPILLLIIIFRDAFREGDYTFGTGTVIVLLYFIAWIVVIPLTQAKISEQYKASWIFLATANPVPGRVHYGQLLAVLCMFFVPTALVIYPLVLLVWGGGLLADIFLSAGGVALVTLVYHFLDKDLPFGRAKEDAKFSNFGPFLLLGILASGLGGLHYLISDWRWVVLGGGVGAWLIVLAWFLWWRSTLAGDGLPRE